MRRRQGDSEIESILCWSDHVLGAAYVARGGRLIVGEGDGCDARVPAAALASFQWEIVAFHLRPRVLPPPGALLHVDGRVVSNDPTELTADSVAEVHFGDFTLRARLVEHEALTPGAWDLRGAVTISISMAAHVVLLGVLFALARSNVVGQMTPDSLAVMRRLLAASEASQVDAGPVRPLVGRGDQRARHYMEIARSPTRASTPVATELVAPLATTAPVASHDSPSRLLALEDAQGFGMIALARGMSADGPPAPSWSEALAAAEAHADAVKSMFGDPKMEDWGAGGLGLSGVGMGGGGKAGDGKEVETEVGVLSEMLERERATFVPGAIVKVPDTHARLGPRVPLDQVPAPPLSGDAVARLVRANIGRVLACQGLVQKRDPTARGEVDVAFIVEPDGRVGESHDAGGDFPDPAVRQCVARVFFGLTFPAEPRRRPQRMRFPIVLGPSVRE